MISDIHILPPPENMTQLLSKIRRVDKAKREEETTMLRNMFEVVIDMDALQTYLEA